MLNIFGVVVFHTSMVNWSGGAFYYMWNLFSAVVFHRSTVSWRRGAWYMCMLLSVKLFGCSSIPYIYDQLEGGTSALHICALCYMLNIFGVAVLHRYMVNCWSGVLGICALCYLWNFFGVAVFHTSMVNWRGSICP